MDIPCPTVDEADIECYSTDEPVSSYAVDSDLTLSGELENNQKKTAVIITLSGSDQQGDLWNNGVDLSASDSFLTQQNNSSSNQINSYEILSDVTDIISYYQDNIDSDSLGIESNASPVNIGVSLQFMTSKVSNITGINLVTTPSLSGGRDWDFDISFGKKHLYIDYMYSNYNQT